MLCQEFAFGYEKEIGRREGNCKEFLVYRVGIRIEFRAKMKILLISTAETRVHREKTPQTNVRADC
jgi:hypothetical protein